MGLPAVRWPITSLVLLALFSLFCAMGLPLLKTDHSLSELFSSDTQEFADYKLMSDRFPTSEFDILIVVESDDLMTPEKLETIRSLHLDLQLAEAVNGIISIFSMRGPPDATGYPPPLLPTELPKGEEFEKLAKRVVDHPLIGGKLLSRPDGRSQLTLLILSLKQEIILLLRKIQLAVLLSPIYIMSQKPLKISLLLKQFLVEEDVVGIV